MIRTSDAYLTAITSDVEQTVFNAEFGFVPPGAREGLTLLSSGFGHLWGSRLTQLNNRVYSMGAKWMSLELNRSTLGGGGEYIDPLSPRQTGDWSTAQSREDGTFEVPPYIEMTLDEAYDIIGVQIIFDDLGMEWATEIKVSYYDSGYALIEERTLQNNRASMPIDWAYNGVKRIKISIEKWNLPRRFAKVCQMIPGQIRYFNNDNTYSFELNEKISPFASLTIPEYTITFANESQEYNIINPQGLVSKLREFMEIPSSIGVITEAGIESISTGNFPLYAWPENADDETATFACRSELGLSDVVYVENGTASTKTIVEVAKHISAKAGLKTEIAVDETLANISVNNNIGVDVPLQDALGQLAVAAGGYIKFERDGTISLKTLDFALPVRTIDYDNMWAKPKIQQSAVFSAVRVRYGGTSEYLAPSGSAVGRIIDVSSEFIASAAEARRIGELAVEYYKNRLTYSIEYRGDMSIETGDVVSVETDYGFRDVFVLEHEITFETQSYLQGRIVGVGIG